MRHILLVVVISHLALVQSQGIAPSAFASSFQNCDCQCDSYQWTNSWGQQFGNCKSIYAGGYFCYVSGRALQACRDVRLSDSRTDSFGGGPKYYSYEACSTPPRSQCFNNNHNNWPPRVPDYGPRPIASPSVPNYGDGDFPSKAYY